MSARRTLQQAASLLMTQLIFILGVSFAHADVIFNVNTTADQLDQDTGDGLCATASGTCSLRAAIMQANHLTGPVAAHIRLPAGNYVLTRPASGADDEDSGDLNFTAPLSAGQTVYVDGAAAGTSIIDANQSDRVMKIGFARSVVLNRVTIRGGFVSFAGGGGLFNEGSLQLVESMVEGNACDYAGGGIYSSGTLDIRRSTLRNNTAFAGGALFANTATVRESSLYENRAGGDGGGIYLPASPATNSLVVVNSTLSANTANYNGGGIYSEAMTSIYSSSIINNDAHHDPNVSAGSGGGIRAKQGAFVLAVNSLFARNTVLNGQTAQDCSGTLEVYGRNLLGTFAGCTFTGNVGAALGLISANTLGPLQDNGGPTWTHALLAGSEAIDATDLDGCFDSSGTTLSIDQRGALRIAGVRCDVGAFEFGSTFDRLFANGFD